MGALQNGDGDVDDCNEDETKLPPFLCRLPERLSSCLVAGLNLGVEKSREESLQEGEEECIYSSHAKVFLRRHGNRTNVAKSRIT